MKLGQYAVANLYLHPMAGYRIVQRVLRDEEFPYAEAYPGLWLCRYEYPQDPGKYGGGWWEEESLRPLTPDLEARARLGEDLRFDPQGNLIGE